MANHLLKYKQYMIGIVYDLFGAKDIWSNLRGSAVKLPQVQGLRLMSENLSVSLRYSVSRHYRLDDGFFMN